MVASAVGSKQPVDQNGAQVWSSQDPQISESEGERNKELFRRLVEEGLNKGDLTVVDELVAPEFKEHQFMSPNHPDGPEGVRETIRGYRNLFPDFTMTIEEMVAVSDKVWVRATVHGTHLGPLMGRPPPTDCLIKRLSAAKTVTEC